MKCVERKSLKETEETCGGGMKRLRIPQQERRQHIKSCASFHQYKLKTNMTQYKHLKNQTRKIVAEAMRMEANQELNHFYQNSNSVFY